ncbi:MAG: hypothetical protein PVF96_01730 [Candidatus Bathyarchaeota archaeon]|jgi:translin
MISLKTILNGIKKELKKEKVIREEAQMKMRKATSLSKQAILYIHQKKLGKAEELIRKARKIIITLNNLATEHPEIIYTGLFSAACQEYSEANIFLRLVKESGFPKPKELGVSPSDYVLGLADVIGEYRRFTLDALREGDLRKGEACLQLMDKIYTELMAMDEAFIFVHGLRRKCDVARRIIEATRGDITQEVRRNSLEKSLKEFETSLGNIG